jgi:hypothetical protein
MSKQMGLDMVFDGPAVPGAWKSALRYQITDLPNLRAVMFLQRFNQHVFQLFVLFQSRVKDSFLDMRVNLELRLNLIEKLFSLVNSAHGLR